MKTDKKLSKWLFRTALLLMGLLIGLGLSIGAAYAQEVTTPPLVTNITAYDSTPPLFTRVDASEDASPDSANLEAEFLDVDSEIDTASDSVTVTDAMLSGCQKSNNKISCKASGMRPGDHSMHVSVKDKYGNRSEREHHFTVRDTVPPVIDSIITSQTSVSVKYHDPAPSSGIASVVVTVDGIRLNCDATGTGCDNDHDGYDADHDGYDQDSDGYFDDSSGNHHDSDGYYHDSDDDHEGSNSSGYTCSIQGTLGCGAHEVVVTVTDKAGNTTTGSTIINGSGDCEPPVTTDNAPAGWQNTDVNVALTCTDALSGCAATTYEVDGGATQTGNLVSLTTDGTHTITYRSVDVAGNIENTKTATVMIDKTPPVVTTPGIVTVEATGPAGATAVFTASATDALSGVVGEPSCDAVSGSTFPLGPTPVTCTAIDAAGNTGSAAMVVSVVDTTAPAVTYSGPTGNIDTDSPTITGIATDAVGVASASVSIDGGPAFTCATDGLGNLSCAASGLADGPHTAVITVADITGNSGMATGTFCKTGKPALVLICPPRAYFDDVNSPGDRAMRWATVDYQLTNNGPDAYNVRIMSSIATNGVYIVDPLPLPLTVGNIAAGQTVTVKIKYYWPVGVPSAKFTNAVCAEDQCGVEYDYSTTGP